MNINAMQRREGEEQPTPASILYSDLEVGWKETCQGETFIDNISDKVVCSLEPMEAAKYLYDYFYKVIINTKGRLISERPEFYVALTTMILGSQFFLAGFIGEIILRNRDHSLRYNVKEIISKTEI